MKIAEPGAVLGRPCPPRGERSLRQADNQCLARRCRLLDRRHGDQVKELVNVLRGRGGSDGSGRDGDKIPELDIPPVESSFMTTFGKSVLFTMWLGCLPSPAATECEG